jgi:hypothetical protein
MLNLRAIGLIAAALFFTLSDIARADSCSDLANAKSFSFGATIISGKIVSSEKAFQSVLHQSDAKRCLVQIMEHGTTEGRMYALVALRELDGNQFRRQIMKLRQRKFKVVILMTQERGAVLTSSGTTVLDQIERGEFSPFFQFYRTGSFHR